MNIKIESPLDMHLHLRDGDMLNVVAPLSAKSFAGVSWQNKYLNFEGDNLENFLLPSTQVLLQEFALQKRLKNMKTA